MTHAIDLGWMIARIKFGPDGKPTSLELFTPPDANDHGVVHPAQHIYLNATMVASLLNALNKKEPA